MSDWRLQATLSIIAGAFAIAAAIAGDPWLSAIHAFLCGACAMFALVVWREGS